VKRVWKKVTVSESVMEIWKCPLCKFDSFFNICEHCGWERNEASDRKRRYARLRGIKEIAK
jgi:hypothetical protein